MKSAPVFPQWLFFDGSEEQAIQLVMSLYKGREERGLKVSPTCVLNFEERTLVFGPVFDSDYLQELRSMPGFRQAAVAKRLADIYRGGFFTNTALRGRYQNIFPCVLITGRSGLEVGVENGVLVGSVEPLEKSVIDEMLKGKVFRRDGYATTKQVVLYHSGRLFSHKSLSETTDPKTTAQRLTPGTLGPRNSGDLVLLKKPSRPSLTH